VTAVPVGLAALWGQVPAIACKGLCTAACANVPCSLTEREVIWQATGVALPDPFAAGQLTGDCPLLTAGGRCSAHEIRPLICRLYGVAKSLPCPHGCTPALGHLPDDTARGLLEQAEHLHEESR
jgi:hypothetical protein